MRRLFGSTVVGLALSLAWSAPQRGQAQSYGTPSGYGSGYSPTMPGYPYAANPYAANPYGMYPPYGSSQGMGYGGYAGMGYGGYSPYGAYAPVAPTSQAEVAIYDNYFEPRTVYLTPGGTVRWTNRGRHVHTVTDYAGNWGSGDIQPGDSYTFTPPVALNHYFYCRHHPLEMYGSIVVRPPQPGPPQGPGGYTNPGY